MPWSFSDMYGRQKVVDANVFPVMVPIFDTILSSAQATIDIQNIPATYAHLKLVYSLALNGSNNVELYARFNNDSGANYNTQQHIAHSTTVAGAERQAQTQAYFGNVPGPTASAFYTEAGEAIIPDYANTTYYKQMRSTSAMRIGTAGGNAYTEDYANMWQSAAAINRITLLLSGQSFQTGSRVTLYGVGVVAPASPGSVLPVQYGTTLPASPLDGQEAILVDNVSTPTYSWRFRYNANSANTDKWEFVGGTPKIVTVSNADTTASSSATDLANVGPAFTAPRAGIYQAQINADGANNTGGGDTFLDFKAGGNAAVSVVRMNRNSTANVGGGGGGWVQGARVNASDVLKMQYHVATGTGTFENRTMAILPVRVS